VRRARTTQPGSLTSLLDVLFILMFAALVQASGRRPAEAGAAPDEEAQVDQAADAGVDAAPAVPAELDRLRQAALAALARQLEGSRVVVARVSADGVLRSVEMADRSLPVGVPLVERVADPDIGLAYLGDRAAELRLCRTLARQLGVTDLADHLVIVAPDRAVRDLPYALVDGLVRDVERCRTEQRAATVIVEPPPPDPATGGLPFDGGTP